MSHAHQHTYVYYHTHIHNHDHVGDVEPYLHEEVHPHGFVVAHDHGAHGARAEHSHKERFSPKDDGTGNHHDPVSHVWGGEEAEEVQTGQEGGE